MYDAHIRAWKRHLERQELKVLLAAKYRVTETWKRELAGIAKRIEGYKDRPWRT